MDRAVSLLVGQLTTAASKRFLWHLDALSLKHVDFQIDQAFSVDSWRRLGVFEDYSSKQRLYRLHAFQDCLKSMTDLVIEPGGSNSGWDPCIYLCARFRGSSDSTYEMWQSEPGASMVQ
jgi:hypothetical protein